jgi:hypothetical protein
MQRYFSPADPGPGPAPAVTPPNPAVPAALLNPDGTYAKDWLTNPLVPESLRGNEQLKTHKSITDTLNNFASLEKIRGHQVVPVPAANSDDATWGVVAERLGRPKSHKEYKLPDAAAAGIKKEDLAPDDLVDGLLQDMHASEMTQRQIERFVPRFNQRIVAYKTQQAQAAEQARGQELAALKTEWAGPAFEANKAGVERFLRSTAPVEDFPRLAAMMEDPRTLRWLHSLSGQFRESQPNLETPTPANVLAEAETKIKTMRADVKGPLYDQHHPQHAAARKEFDDLVAMVEKAKKK